MTAPGTVTGPARPPRLDGLAALTRDLAATAAEADRAGRLPPNAVARLHEDGLVGLTVPTSHGGAGAGLATVVDVLGHVGAGEPATALVLAMTLLTHAGEARARAWPPALYAEVARATVQDGALLNRLRAEPELGTPARGGLPATTATPLADGGWRLRGHKAYSTGARLLTWGVVNAATAEDRPRVGWLLVPMAAPGVRIVETWDHLGMRATESHDVVFEDVVLPPDAALELAEPAAAALDPVAMAWNNLALPAIYLGVATAARDWLVGYLHERVPTNLGRPLATLPRFQYEVGGIEVALSAARQLLHSAASGVDAADQAAIAGAGAVKATVTAAAIDTVGRALALVGNPGLSRRHALERHYRDVLCARIHTPQDDAILSGAGRVALGIR